MNSCIWVTMLVVGIGGCRSSMELSEEERMKLDPMLQSVLTTDKTDDPRLVTDMAPDGVLRYAVLIRSSDPEEVRALKVMVGSVMGDVVTARVTLEELRTIARLRSVRLIEASLRDSHH